MRGKSTPKSIEVESALNPNAGLFIEFVEKNSVPKDSVLRTFGGFNGFKQQAFDYYQGYANRRAADLGYRITNPEIYFTTPSKKREQFSTDMDRLNQTIYSVDRILQIYEEQGVAGVQDIALKMKQNAEVTDLLVNLKEVYNLGVLN